MSRFFGLWMLLLSACGTGINTAADYVMPTPSTGWTPIIETFEGVEMALVPAGCFTLGAADADVDEQPTAQHCFDTPFWIDRYEVTNAQYGSSGEWAGDNRPRERVSWFDALAHCESRSARLPTEPEWEYAARGPDSWLYPWGNTFIADFTVYEGNSGNHTADVGSRARGVSWVGAYDLSGNVWEWVSTVYRFYPYDASDGRESPDELLSRVVRGGSWVGDEFTMRAANRGAFDPQNVNETVGFRCARDDE